MLSRPKTLAFFALLVAVVATVAALRWLPLGEYLGTFAGEIRSWGAWGPAALAAVYILATPLLFPSWLLTLSAGFMFGIVRGSLTIWIASLASASTSFWLGRTIAHDWVQQKIVAHARFEAIDLAVKRQGFKIVLLIRLSPVLPYAFTNYAFGITTVRFRDFFLASAIGMLPLTVVYVYLGSTAQNIAEIMSGSYRQSRAHTALFVFGALATIAFAWYVTRLARSAMRSAVDTARSGDRRRQPTSTQ